MFLSGGFYLRDAPRLIAKLGDLLPVRIIIRASRECLAVAHTKQGAMRGRRGLGAANAAVDQLAGVPDQSSQQVVLNFSAASDPRSGDMLAFGTIVLLLFSADEFNDDDEGKTINSAAVGRILDRGMRLVVMRCMEKDPQNRMSASMATRALEGALRGDAFLGMEAAVGDLSKSAPLLDADLEAIELTERRRDLFDDDKKPLVIDGESVHN